MNLYVLLGLTPDAAPEAITQAYRKLRSASHPDRHGDASMFHQLQQAYEVLSDPARRAQYDQTGETTAPAEDRLQQVLVALIVGAIDQCPDVDHTNLIAVVITGVDRQLQAFHQQVGQSRANKRVATHLWGLR